MRVLHINTSEMIGGAAIAAGRLMRTLNRHGIEAEMLVRDKQTDNPRVLTLPNRLCAKVHFITERLEISLGNGFSSKNLFAIDTGRYGTDITRLPAYQKADVIHLHWINQGMLSLRNVEKVLQSGKKVVWTMHDMWPFTGVCHQAGDCRAWEAECRNCPLLKHPGINDMASRVYGAKAHIFSKHSLTFVACSNWLADLARRSPLLQGQRVESIPNPIDTHHYSPASRSEARRQLGLPADKRLVLFVAYKATDPNKGIDYLRQAAKLLKEEHSETADNLAVVVVGREAEQLKGTMAVPVIAAEYVSDPDTMRSYYRAADILAMPTLMDNLPNTIVEAMACGVPCVGFRVGGLPQMIDHGHNGFLADYKNADSLAQGLHRLLSAPDYDRYSIAARQSAVDNYSEEVIADRYKALYEEEY